MFIKYNVFIIVCRRPNHRTISVQKKNPRRGKDLYGVNYRIAEIESTHLAPGRLILHGNYEMLDILDYFSYSITCSIPSPSYNVTEHSTPPFLDFHR